MTEPLTLNIFIRKLEAARELIGGDALIESNFNIGFSSKKIRDIHIARGYNGSCGIIFLITQEN